MSLSKGQSFSKSELEALGLWDVAEQFGKKKQAAIQNGNNKSTPLTVEKIESMQKQAYDEAFAQGTKEGYEKGYQEGSKNGYDQGFEQGKTEGSKKGYEENLHLLRKQTADLLSLLESLSEPFKEFDEEIEKELVRLSIGIASQLIRREIKIDPGQIIAVIREAVNILPVASQKLTLHMHPDDAELVRSSLAIDDVSPPWDIIEEPLITRGGCKVKTEVSSIDATVENRLASIVATVLGGEREEDDT
ncbi:MAG: flagellar assembly protein FliH [Gammaproteobacteria bacterium]|nr:MAG: flagellar assembly protein FliH [Gammaproteobacteria bacterium]